MARSTPLYLATGVDFGTAFTKVMIRNTTTEDLFAVPFPRNGKQDFFLPSVLFIRDGHLVHPIGHDGGGIAETVPYLKMALAEKCRATPEHWSTLVARSNGNALAYALEDYIEALTGCFLVDVVRYARAFAQTKWPDFGSHPEDRMYFQMSIPAEDAQQEAILERFKKCLYWAVEKAASGQQEPTLQKFKLPSRLMEAVTIASSSPKSRPTS